MKVAEILRSLANLIDAEEQQAPAQQQPIVVNVNNGSDTAPPAETAPKEQPSLADKLGIINLNKAEAEEPVVDDDALGVMVPPLQQKIELIKKSEGVKSVYDGAQEEDELAVLKRQAGIKTAVIADEDEPFEG
jgi:hypothetical protein